MAGEEEEVELEAKAEEEEGERRDEESERIVCDAMDLSEDPSASRWRASAAREEGEEA